MKKQNFIFDLGNVLLTYQPQQFLMGMFGDEALCDALRPLIFESAEWAAMDRGMISYENATLAFAGRRPDLRDEIVRVMTHIPDMMVPIESTAAMLPRVAEAGHGIYFLSNYHHELIPGAKRRDFFRWFQGGIFSCDVHLCKPEPEIYNLLLDTYGLDASTCVFFDDMPQNAEGANRVGIEGVVFTGAQDVERYL